MDDQVNIILSFPSKYSSIFNLLDEFSEEVWNEACVRLGVNKKEENWLNTYIKEREYCDFLYKFGVRKRDNQTWSSKFKEIVESARKNLKRPIYSVTKEFGQTLNLDPLLLEGSQYIVTKSYYLMMLHLYIEKNSLEKENNTFLNKLWGSSKPSLPPLLSESSDKEITVGYFCSIKYGTLIILTKRKDCYLYYEEEIRNITNITTKELIELLISLNIPCPHNYSLLKLDDAHLKQELSLRLNSSFDDVKIPLLQIYFNWSQYRRKNIILQLLSYLAKIDALFLINQPLIKILSL